MTNNDRFNYLVFKYTSGYISFNEQEELFDLVSSGLYDQPLSQLILEELRKGSTEDRANIPPHISEEILRNIFKADKNISKILTPTKKADYLWRWIVAAACVVGFLFTTYLFNKKDKGYNGINFTAIIPDNAITKFNNTQKVQVITLPDGSEISLQPNSLLHYPAKFGNDKREVYLEGEAFFQITKNPDRPFLVYYNRLVTKVLGTSFSIHTNLATGHVEIVVKTGKVQVYENEELVKENKQENAVIITPNEKAIYKEENRLFQTTLVENPAPILNNEKLVAKDSIVNEESYIYHQEKLFNIFAHLSKRYGIEIAVEHTGINNCVFTGDISDNNLFNKLKIICLTTNTSYEVNGITILIKGKGCN